MRKIGKKRQADFVKMATEKIIAIGAIPQEPKYEHQHYQEFLFEAKNPIKFTLYPVGHHDTCYSIFGRYESPIPNVSPNRKNNFHEVDFDSLDKTIDYYLLWATRFAKGISSQI